MAQIDDAPALEDLRRRVYSAGATDDDRAEYRRLLEAGALASAGTAESPPPSRPAEQVDRPATRRPRTLLLLLGVAAVAVVLAVAVPAASPRVAPADPVPAPTSVSVDPGIAASFLANLKAGRMVGLAAYLRSERFQTPLRDATRYSAIERWGVGPRSLQLRPPADAPTAGRVTVILVVDASGRAGWTLSTLRPYLRANDPLNVLGTRAGAAEAGTPTFASVRYRSTTAPSDLRVDVPDGVRWGVAVVLSD